jgi:cytoskeletal protein CcmA (bactofilin family)
LSYFSPSKNERDLKAMKTPEPRIEAPKAMARPVANDVVSTFGPGMLIAGNIVCAGALQIHGRVTGEIHVASLVICEGAKVEGKVVAQDTVIKGSFKGTIHGNSVKLQGNAVVDGEIFNKTLTIEESALFEGVSRRLDRPVETPSMDEVRAEKTASAPVFTSDRAPLQAVPSYDPVA